MKSERWKSTESGTVLTPRQGNTEREKKEDIFDKENATYESIFIESE